MKRNRYSTGSERIKNMRNLSIREYAKTERSAGFQPAFLKNLRTGSPRSLMGSITVTVAIFFAIFLSGTCLSAQDITGQWNGVLSVQGTKLRLVFHINKTGEGYMSTMDSPDQGATGIPVNTTTFDGSKLSLTITSLGASYEGEFKTDSIEGTFRQSGMSFPMTSRFV